jgi:hypothetical protein
VSEAARQYAPRFSKRVTLGALAAVTIGTFAVGMALPYVVGDDPADAVRETTTETTARRRQPVPVAQIVPSTTTTTAR